MRIIGELPHPQYKVTLFQHDEKLSIKFEWQLLEQVYIFRMGPGMDSAGQLKQLVDDDFLREVEEGFARMDTTRDQALQRQARQANEDWPEII